MQDEEVKKRIENRRLAGLIIILAATIIFEMAIGGTLGMIISMVVITYASFILLGMSISARWG